MMQKNKIVIFPHLVPFCQALSHMYFYFNPFSVQSRFTMYHYTSMHTHICTHVSDARAIYNMQIDFAEFCRGQSVTAAKQA